MARMIQVGRRLSWFIDSLKTKKPPEGGFLSNDLVFNSAGFVVKHTKGGN
jgi:hypothetical protein